MGSGGVLRSIQRKRLEGMSDTIVPILDATTPQPHVDIVTPVFNDARYLTKCIESVLAQTYKNWDYTIVDNCSTDQSLQIAQRYAARFPRIKVIRNQVFLPAIANHNVALRQISPVSKYGKIVFSDDWIFPDCLERMVAVAEANPSVGIVGAYCLWGTEERNEVGWTGLPYPSTVVTGRDICRLRFLNGLSVFGSGTSVLYRADLVRSRDPFYCEDNVHPDSEACLALLKTCDFGFVHQILTFTRAHPESISSALNDHNTLLATDLLELVNYGPYYLSSEEWDACLKQHISKYYSFLGKRLLSGWDRQFWEYHRHELSKAGVAFDRTRLAAAALAELAKAVLNPKDAIAKLLKRHARNRVAQNHRGPGKTTVFLRN